MPKYEVRKPNEKDLKILPPDSLPRSNEYLTEGYPLAIPFQLRLHTGTLIVEQALIREHDKWVYGTTKIASSE